MVDRVSHHVEEQIEALFEKRLGDLAPVDGQLLLGSRVENAADPFDGTADVAGGGPRLRALEDKVLDRVWGIGLVKMRRPLSRVVFRKVESSVRVGRGMVLRLGSVGGVGLGGSPFDIPFLNSIEGVLRGQFR